MFGFSIFKTIATGIAKPFTIVGTAVRDMYATIKAKIVRQPAHKANLISFANVDVEAARGEWVAPRISCPGTCAMPLCLTFGGQWEADRTLPLPLPPSSRHYFQVIQGEQFRYRDWLL